MQQVVNSRIDGRRRVAGRAATVALALACSLGVASPANAALLDVAAPAVGTGPVDVEADPTSSLRTFVASNTSGVISILDGTTNASIGLSVILGGTHGLALDATRRRLYVTRTGSNSVAVLDADTLSQVVFPGIAVGSHPNEAAVHGARNLIYVVNRLSNSVSVISGVSMTVVATIPVLAQPFDVTVDEVADRVYIANYGANKVTIVNAATQTVVGTISVGVRPSAVAFNATTRRLYVANEGGNSVSVIDTTTLTVIATIGVGNSPALGLAVDPVGNRAFVTNYGSLTMSVIDGATNTVIQTIGTRGQPYGVAWNPTTRKVTVAAYSISRAVIYTWLSRPPTITASVSPPSNAAGWHSSDVTVTYTCADPDGDLASCSAPVTITLEGADQIVTGVASDREGNTTSVSVTIDLDESVPSVAVSRLLPSPLPAEADPPVRALIFEGTAHDVISGVAAVEITLEHLVTHEIRTRFATCTGCGAADSTATWSLISDLAPGPYEATVVAIDLADNRSPGVATTLLI